MEMNSVKYADLPEEYREKIHFSPTEPFYFVVDEEAGEEYGMNDTGGERQYGSEWKLIKSGMLEGYRVCLLDVTIH